MFRITTQRMSVALPFAMMGLVLTTSLGCAKAAPQGESKVTPAPAGTGEKIAVPGPSTEGPMTSRAPGGDIGSVPVPTAPSAPADSGPDASFELTVTPPANPVSGAKAMAQVVVKPGPGYKVNKEFPTKLSLTAPAGVSVDKAVIDGAGAAKLDDHELRFEVAVSADKPGTYQIPGELKFAVCTAETCDPKKRSVSIALTVQ